MRLLTTPSAAIPFLRSLAGIAVLSLLVWGCTEKQQEAEAEPAAGTSQTEPENGAAPPPETVTFSAETLAGLESYTIACGGEQIDLAGPVGDIAADLESRNLLYATEDLTDCSGIFHRVLQAMQQRCPDYAYPTVDQARDTRDLARWYRDRGELVLVQDALAGADLIKPGAVLFYGQRGVLYENFAAEELLAPKTGINHMGVVVRVHKNAAGEVESYELFHGHGKKGKTPASTTNWHRRKPTRAAYPPLGNGEEQWIAFALLVNPYAQALTQKQ